MEISHIKDLLLKYRELVFRDTEKRRMVCEVILNVSGIRVVESELNIQNGKLHIKGDSVTKNELFLYKERILDELGKIDKIGITEIA